MIRNCGLNAQLGPHRKLLEHGFTDHIGLVNHQPSGLQHLRCAAQPGQVGDFVHQARADDQLCRQREERMVFSKKIIKEDVCSIIAVPTVTKGPSKEAKDESEHTHDHAPPQQPQYDSKMQLLLC